MLEAQREERAEYVRMLNERKWQQECERKVRAYQLESSAARAAERSRSRRVSEAVAPEPPLEPVPEARSPPTRRIASIVHRIVRREGSETLTTGEAQALINRGLKRLGLRALALGSFALVSAVAYMQLLQTEQAQEAQKPAIIDGVGILQAPELAASAEEPVAM